MYLYDYVSGTVFSICNSTITSYLKCICTDSCTVQSEFSLGLSEAFDENKMLRNLFGIMSNTNSHSNQRGKL